MTRSSKITSPCGSEQSNSTTDARQQKPPRPVTCLPNGQEVRFGEHRAHRPLPNLDLRRQTSPENRRFHAGASFNCAILARIAANISRDTATSAIWKMTYREWATTFAPILISFSRSVVNDQCATLRGNARQQSPQSAQRPAEEAASCLLALGVGFHADTPPGFPG